MWLTSSSIGRKFVMALTGAFLILFVTFHVLMNGVALFWPTAYNDICAFLGANWYALIGTGVLAAGFVLHILYALWLTYENRRARGNDRYAVTSRPKQVEWASKNMLVLGVVVICFLIVHLYQFWAKMQLPEILGLPTDYPPAAGTLFIQEAFKCPWTLIVYLIGFAALWLHMTHGFWSMCHSSGVSNNKWLPRLRVIGNVWATAVCLLFAVEAIVFTVQAKDDFYTNDPALIEQYNGMEHHNKPCDAATENGAACADKAVCSEKAAACANHEGCDKAAAACAGAEGECCGMQCGVADCNDCASCEACAGECPGCPHQADNESQDLNKVNENF